MTTDTAQPTASAPAITASVTLEEPITRGDQTIGTVTVRRPSAGQLRGLNLLDLMQMKTDAMVEVLPRITAPTLLKHEVEKLCPADFTALASEVVLFFAPKAAREQATPQP